jgi:hypothetical protein
MYMCRGYLIDLVALPLNTIRQVSQDYYQRSREMITRLVQRIYL